MTRKPDGFYSNMTKKQWLAYGKNRGHDQLSRSELKEKENRHYIIGLKKKWINKLIPELKKRQNGFFKYMNKKKWIAYGKEKGYDKLSRENYKKKKVVIIKKVLMKGGSGI